MAIAHTDTPHRGLGTAAAGAAMLLGIAHVVVTTALALVGRAEFTPAHLAWVVVPALICGVGLAPLGLILGRSSRPAAIWVALSGVTAVLTWGLSVIGLLPALGAGSPADLWGLFAGPGPYALPAAVLYTVLTLRAARTRRTVPRV
ncbi:hypothetical protein PWG71_20205 [Nocardiopsis sp. N85]|uniref:hypothetical protein n=1 Tax=Nocardiopsis sp. N85 TaxID=3029400 RepID=UPI00237F82FE|nr:hypothetical protein [Nocardiopsis sp. N85]MDE3723720.1 hypothetical protein [Nocardiopsis sp. N85]